MKQFIQEFAGIDDSTAQAFVDLFTYSSLKKGDNFISEGETGHKVAFIKEGLLRSYYISPKGDEYNKHFFLAGVFVAPLTSLVLKTPSPLYIGALENTSLLIADYNDVEKLYKEKPLLNRLGRILVEFAWIGKERRETQLIMTDARERYKTFIDEYPGLEQRIPQYHIASYLGITPVQLSRIRSSKN